MNILGINFSHDASVTFIRDNMIIAAMEEEKISRCKQDFGWPRKALERLFYEYDVKPEEIDIIAFDEEILRSYSKYEIKFRMYKNPIVRCKEIIDRVLAYFLGYNRIKPNENRDLLLKLVRNEGFVNTKLEFHNHHLCHAATAHYPSPIDCDLLITSDGRGGEEAFNFYKVEDGEMVLIRMNDYSVSVGAFYSAITELLGFKPNRHEGKITGLAAFGKETKLVHQFRDLFQYNDSGALSRFPFDKTESYWNQHKLSDELSLGRRINLRKSSNTISEDFGRRNLALLHKLSVLTANHSKEDIAYACQLISEEVTLSELNAVVKNFGLQNLNVGLAGGVFANVRINQKIYENEAVTNIFVQPAMGDAGLSMGAALLSRFNSNHTSVDRESFRFTTTFLGADYSKEFQEFPNKLKDASVVVRKMEEPAKEVAKLLAKNAIIGLMSGRMEWGPRALGNRSIILNTFDKEVNKTLNDRLNRTEFMPFAPVVLDTIAKIYFPKYKPEVPAADYMTITYDTDLQFSKILQATVHVDGTARPQIAYSDKSPLYYGILREFQILTQCGALVNTSFNAHEEPILSSPETGLNALKTGRVDYLVMGEFIYQLTS